MVFDPDSAYDSTTRAQTLAGLSPIAQFAINLYNRCSMFNEIALPEEGGILDQDELLVLLLEKVHNEVMEIRLERMENISRTGSQPNIPGVDPKKVENIKIGNTRRTRRG